MANCSDADARHDETVTVAPDQNNYIDFDECSTSGQCYALCVDVRGKPDDRGNPTVNFHGEKRSNQTHESTTDPEAKLARKGDGKESKLSYSGHGLMENRNGLCVDLRVAPATGYAERDE